MTRVVLNIDRVLRQDRLLRALTGLNRKAFEALLPNFSEVYRQSLLDQPRQRPSVEAAKGGCIGIRLPHKKPRGETLSPEQKAENRTLSQSRVSCENAFAGVKRYGAVSAIYRNRKPNFDDHLANSYAPTPATFLGEK